MHPLSTHEYYGGRMANENEITHMVHYECHTCGIGATCVLNSAARLAWHDHMSNHAVKTGFSQWFWAVEPLPFD